MSNNNQVIEQIHFALRTNDALAKKIQQRCSEIFHYRIKSLLHRLLSQADSQLSDKIIDAITLDLGDIPLDEFEEQLYEKIKQQLPGFLTPAAMASASNASTPAVQRAFLEKNTHPIRPDNKSASASQITAPDNGTDNPFTLLTDYLATGIFARPKEWTTPAGADGWLMLLLSLAPIGQSASGQGLAPLTNLRAMPSLFTMPDLDAAALEHARYQLAQYCLQRRGSQRLRQTFGPAALKRLQQWFIDGLPANERQLVAANNPHSTVGDIALMVLQRLTQQIGYPTLALAERDILWPTSLREWQRWLGILLTASSAYSRILLYSMKKLENLPRLSVTLISGINHAEREKLLPLLQYALGFKNIEKDPAGTHALALLREFPALVSIERGDIPFSTIEKNIALKDSALPEHADEHTRPESRDLSQVKNPVENDPLTVSNAGIVLLWPLLPRLFDQWGLLHNKTFISQVARNKAVCWLDHLIWQDGMAAEWRTPFTQWLCGWPQDSTLEWFPPDEVIDQEITLFQSTLPMLIPSLHRCSPSDIRQMFLQRGGELTLMKRGWTLTADDDAIDILLRDLTWPMREVRFPWLDETLFVNWL